MKAAALVARIRELDGKIWLDGDQLRIDAPKGAITPELQKELAAGKPELLRFLKQAQAAPIPVFTPGAYPIHEGEDHALSFAQQRLWMVNQYQPEDRSYTVVKVYEISGELDCLALEQSISRILARHSALRSIFPVNENNQPVQRVLPHSPFHLPVIDLQDLPPEQREAEARSRAYAFAHRGFSLESGPLFRANLLRLAPEHHWLVVTMHHIVSDGWSLAIFARELKHYYHTGQPETALPPLQVAYIDFADWQRQALQQEALQDALAFWRETLRKPLPVLELPADRAPGADSGTRRGAVESTSLPDELGERIALLCQQQGATPFMLLLAAYQILLARYTQAEDVIVGTAVANRPHPALENLIGFFVNTLALRTNLGGNPTFLELLGRVRETTLQAFAYQDVPFEMVVEEVNPERSLRHSPIFQTMFVLQNTPSFHAQGTEPGRWLNLDSVAFDPGTTKYDLSLEAVQSDSGYRLHFEYNNDLFDAQTIRRMAGHYHALLESICEDPGQPITQLNLLTTSEQQTLAQWNATSRAYPQSVRVHQLVEAQALLTPDATAVQDEQESISYLALEQRANQLAQYLRSRGMSEGSLVGLCLPRTNALVAALLAVQKAGCAYVPLDPNYPQERLDFMQSDSGVEWVISDSQYADRFAARAAQLICLDREYSVISNHTTQPIPSTAGPQDLAYILYTSGSTGRPKGVLVQHNSVVNLLLSMQHDLKITPADTCFSITNLTFDIAELEVYLPLISGASILLATNAAAADGELLRGLLERSQATFFQATPSTLRLLVNSGWQGDSRLRILSGGEALAQDLTGQLLERCGCLWNGYGPTETTIYSTLTQINSGEKITIGRPVANTQIHILDPHGLPVPVGVAGELYIGGAGVARGYRNREDLTTARFVTNLPGRLKGQRCYRTGDLARFLPDGRIDYLGRNDDQVKINGVRVELGEVTASLLQHSGIRSAAVLYKAYSDNRPALTAYIVLHKNGRSPSADVVTAGALRSFLSNRLPSAMIPTHFVVMEELPLTSSGKVDRQALPEPSPEGEWLDGDSRAPSLLELQLIQIWKRLLRVKQIHIHDDFFALGGHSMLAVQMFMQIREKYGVTLPLISIFRNATIAYQAQLIEKEQQNQGVSHWSSLVNLQPTGIRPPLFCVHGMPGDVLWYSRLVRYMDPSQQIWGLQSQGLDGIQPPLTSIEAMAELYIREMESIQPEPPYFLCGYSFGGTVAFEICRQLQQKGKAVGLLAMIDHASPKSGYYEVRWNRQFVRGYLRNLPYRIADLMVLRPDEIQARLRRNWSGIRNRFRKTQPLQNTQDLNAEDIIVNADQLPQHVQELIKINFQAMYDYMPTFYDGKVTLLRARGGHLLVSHDPDMGWQNFARDVDIRVIPGSHLGLFREPNIGHLARQIQQCLDENQPPVMQG